MAYVAVTTATQKVTAGARLTIQVAGELPPWLSDGVFKERLTLQLEMAGFDVDTIEMSSSYGMTSRGWKGTIAARFNAITNVSNIIANVRGAAERAGSYRPTATIPSYGQPDQPDPKNTLPDLLSKPFQTINLVVIGIVVLVGFLAFGPNVGKIAGAVRGGRA